MKKNNVFSTVLTIVMVIECLLLVVTAFVFWDELTYEFNWYWDENHFIYCIEDERYGDMVSGYYSNELSGRISTRGLRECYGVAKYYEAALWYNAYEIVGDTAKSAIYAEKMADAYEEMGDYQFMDSKIRKKLNME